MKYVILLFYIIIFSIKSYTQIIPSSKQDIERSFETWKKLKQNSIFNDYEIRNIGPEVMGGRITDIIVDPNKSKHFYIGFASGGIFETTNNGISFNPIFDNQCALGIGDMEISPSNPSIIWVGTGENNSSRSSYAGCGVFKSTDAGKSWQHMELTNTQHISRIIIHPSNPDIVWVASIGSLYSNNAERGVYKTNDGGKTWKKTLFINEAVGIIDLIIHPSNSNKLWAASWERNRKAWHFDGDGSGSAIFFSSDGGETWIKSVNGFAQSEKTGRIGLAISLSNPEIIYALLDNQEEYTEEEEKKDTSKYNLKELKNFSNEEFQKLNDAKLDTLLRKEMFPKKYTSKILKEDIKSGKYTPKNVSEYFEDANANLFNKKLKGAEIYKSNDGGINWKKINDEILKGVYFTYGYYFGQIRIAPDNPDKIYFAGVPFIKSEDGGKTFSRLDTLDIHVDHHALWINPNDPEHLILGNDGGLYISYDEGKQWLHMNNIPAGQFYTVNVDMEKPYNVYGGLQDNGVYRGSSKSVPNRTKPWDRIIYGDGMYVASDPENNNLVYTGYQFGNYFRCDLSLNKYDHISPLHDIGNYPYRYNWRTPLIMSPHNSEILYCGNNYLFRSLNKGDSWERVSEDLTVNKQPQGNVPYSTISAIAESQKKFNLIWVGTDDGNIHITQNGGNSWALVSKKLPQNRWVSSIFASPHDESTAFVTLNGYRYDEFKTYLFKTSDYGKTWTSLKGNLPEDVFNVLLQDPVNKELLYAGSDHGTYVSLDGGVLWNLLTNLPNVSTYDMIVHPRENELVIATHGRSIFIMDVKPLQKVAGTTKDTSLILFKPTDISFDEKWGEKEFPYSEKNESNLKIQYYIGKDTSEKEINFKIEDTDGKKIKDITGTNEKGFHYIKWNLNINEKKYIGKGKYKISCEINNMKSESEFEIK